MGSKPPWVGRIVLFMVGMAIHAACGAASSVVMLSERSSETEQARLRDATAFLNRSGRKRPVVTVRHLQVDVKRADVLSWLRANIAAHRDVALYPTTLQLARLAKEATTALPIVFDGADDPVKSCVVASDAHPGGNVTGFTSYVPYTAKMAETLLQAFRHIDHLIVLDAFSGSLAACDDRRPRGWQLQLSPSQPCGAIALLPAEQTELSGEFTALHAYLKGIGVRLSFIRTCSVGDFDAMSAILRAQPRAGIIVPLYQLYHRNARLLAERIEATRLPAIYARLWFLQQGGLMALSPAREQPPWLRSLEMLDQVLDGAPPATTPVRKPTGFQTILNVAAAERAGLRPSVSYLRRTDSFVRY